jgi:hypothetical protein
MAMGRQWPEDIQEGGPESGRFSIGTEDTKGERPDFFVDRHQQDMFGIPVHGVALNSFKVQMNLTVRE